MCNDIWSPIPRADAQHQFFTHCEGGGGGCRGSVTNGGGGGKKWNAENMQGNRFSETIQHVTLIVASLMCV